MFLQALEASENISYTGDNYLDIFPFTISLSSTSLIGFSNNFVAFSVNVQNPFKKGSNIDKFCLLPFQSDDGWMPCEFVFLTVCLSYQDDG